MYSLPVAADNFLVCMGPTMGTGDTLIWGSLQAVEVLVTLQYFYFQEKTIFFTFVTMLTLTV